MDLRGELTALKNRVMAAIEQAAKEGDERRIIELSALLAEIKRDEQQAVGLEERLGGHRARLDTPSEVRRTAQPLEVAEVTGGPQRRRDPRVARRLRQDWERERLLTPERPGGAISRTSSGKRVGTAVATEDPRDPDRWFLGVQDTQLDCVALLCQAGNELLDFVLPMVSLSDVWPELSRRDRQVKFNVLRVAPLV